MCRAVGKIQLFAVIVVVTAMQDTSLLEAWSLLMEIRQAQVTKNKARPQSTIY